MSFLVADDDVAVISPEGCASILLKDASKAHLMAEQLRLTAQGAQDLGVIDGIIAEPLGAAHRSPEETARNLRSTVFNAIEELQQLSPEDLVAQRRAKFLAMGEFCGE